ncbi:MAG: glucosidase, partial [Micrococcales bacterium]|nr:glucosidase [Micrococcales bacterium]
MTPSAESSRLAAADAGTQDWRLWGPYLAGRQWGTVREDYSADGDAWAYLPFDDSHRRAYRWGEDGIAGLTDAHGFLALALALWNGRDDRLKERYFGLTNGQGNHGEDVKEYWWHIDATPTHSYAETLYRYPQGAFPYAALLAESARRGREVAEFELADTGILDGDRFFDVRVVHAKAAPDDICVEIQATNEGPDAAPLHLVPQLWFRNTWAWGRDDRIPSLRLTSGPGEAVAIEAHHDFLGDLRLEVDDPEARALFCDNETDSVALFGTESNRTPWPKDGVGRAIVDGDEHMVNPAGTGTKAGIHRVWEAVAPGETVRLRLRLRPASATGPAFAGSVDPRGSSDAGDGGGGGDRDGFEEVVTRRREEAEAFYAEVLPDYVDDVDRVVARRAFAGLLWCK